MRATLLPVDKRWPLNQLPVSNALRLFVSQVSSRFSLKKNPTVDHSLRGIFDLGNLGRPVPCNPVVNRRS